MRKEHPLIIFIKYAAVGGVAVAAELSLLHALTSRTGLWYVYASALSSLLGFIISFALRKLWVFEDWQWADVPRQLSFYLITLAVVVGTNTLLMSFLVEHYGLSLLLAQFSAGLLTGLFGFVINWKFTFHYR